MTDQFISPIETSFTYDLVLRWRGFGDLFYVVRETLSESQCSGSGKDKAASSLIERDAKRALVMNSEGKLTAPSGAVSLDHTVLSDSSDDTRTILFRMALSSFRIYQDLVTRRRAPVREAAVPQPECALRPDGSNLIHVLHTLYSGHKESKNNIDAGMQAAFGQDFHELIFGPTEDERIRFGVRWRNLNEPVFAPSLSDGTLRFLMLLAVLAYFFQFLARFVFNHYKNGLLLPPYHFSCNNVVCKLFAIHSASISELGLSIYLVFQCCQLVLVNDQHNIEINKLHQYVGEITRFIIQLLDATFRFFDTVTIPTASKPLEIRPRSNHKAIVGCYAQFIKPP